MSRFLVLLLGAALLWSTPLHALEVEVSEKSCRQLVEHYPDSSVSADYQPGLDVRGKAVAPADLNSGAEIEPPDEVRFRLTFTPLDDRRYAETSADLGELTVKNNGRVYFQGMALQDEEAYELSRKCQELLKTD